MNQNLSKLIKEKAENYLQEVISWRRHLHAHPELSFEEKETSMYVQNMLNVFGIPFINNVAENGVVAIIEGKDPDSAVYGLRADMDALPIQEENDKTYRSVHPGTMHACGHDAHTASMLGAAKILHELREEWSGTIKILFQPAEEKMPGGASRMIREGALKNPDVSGIIGQHVLPQLEAGKVGFRSGMYMAACDEIYITVNGRGGHGAAPELLIDPVLISSHLIVALQQVISRRASPKSPSVLSFGKVLAHGATNIIPDKVIIEGTFRSLNEKWRAEAHQIIYDMSRQLVASMGGQCDINIVKGYPYLENHPGLTALLRKAAVEYLGEENVVDLDIWMAGEDFAYYTHEVPGCFYRFGVRNEDKGIISPVHTSTFDIDESSLEIGMGLMAWSAVCCLHQESFSL